MTLAKTFAALVERMNKQIAEWDEDEPRDDWWQYQRDFATAAREIAEALGERERIVAWLRDNAAQYVPGCSTQLKVAALANAIERGEHNHRSQAMKVTDEDRALLDAIEALEVHDDEAALMACELIATHRQSAERRALDRAAEVATSIGEQYGEDETGWFECSETIATAIRALGDE